MPWLAATRSAPRDIGSWTFQSSCRVGGAGRRGRLDDRGGTVPDPGVDEPDDRRHGVDDRRDDRREPARREQRHGRDQVDERRHRLGRVEQRPEDGAEPVVARREDPQGEADGERDAVATRTIVSVCIAVLPEAEQDDERPGRRATITGPATPGRRTRRGSDDADDQPPRRRREHPLERVQDQVVKPSLMAAVRRRERAVIQSTTVVDRSRTTGARCPGMPRGHRERPAPEPRRSRRAERSQTSSRRRRVGSWTGGSAGRCALARALGQPVEDDRQDDDREARLERRADVHLADRARRTSPPRPGAPMRAGDHDHRERHHDRLVDAEADRRGGPAGSCTLRRTCRRVAPSELAASMVSPGTSADPERRDPDGGRDRVDERGDRRRRRRRCEQQRHRREVRERRHDLHDVEDRRDQRADRGRCGPPRIPSGMPISSEMTHRGQHQGERLHAGVPQARGCRAAANPAAAPASRARRRRRSPASRRDREHAGPAERLRSAASKASTRTLMPLRIGVEDRLRLSSIQSRTPLRAVKSGGRRRAGASTGRGT